MSKLSKDYWLNQKFSFLTLDPNQELPNEWSYGSHKKFEFICNCGASTVIPFKKVLSGHTSSCGHCNDKSKEYWLDQTCGELRLDPNQEFKIDKWAKNSNRKFIFICSCGGTSHIKFQAVTLGNSSSCGHCNDRSKEYWLPQTWGKLKLDPSQELPDEWGIGSHKKFRFVCDCGTKKMFPFCYIVKQISCGKCNYKPKEYWLSQRFGYLILDSNQKLPDEWSYGTHKKFRFVCDCGRYITLSINQLISRNYSSCSQCNDLRKEYWLAQKWGMLKLDFNQQLPKEWGHGAHKKFKFLCDCGKHKHIPFYNIMSGNTKSCGCVRPGYASYSAQTKLREFVTTLDPDTYLDEYPIQLGTRHSYDIYIPSKKIAIEHHGLYYHSEANKAGQKDYKKYLLAQSLGDRLIQIYEDEWKYKQEIVEEYLRSIIQPRKRIRIKPIYSIEEFNSTHNDFLSKHHLFGAIEGVEDLDKLLTITAKHGDELVGVWVFNDNVWIRSCFYPKYKTWNSHSKALDLALTNLKGKVIAYSDNRLHTGEMYKKLGFKLDEEIEPKAQYTYSDKRQQFNLGDKWKELWDSGSKKWVLDF